MDRIHIDTMESLMPFKLPIRETNESHLYLVNGTLYKIFKENVKDLQNKEKKLLLLHPLLKGKNSIYPIELVYLHNTFIGYTMPYIESLTLEEYIYSPSKITLPLLYKARREIEKFHQMGILLGDIHLRNILVDKEGNVHLCDLDNASILGLPYDCLRDFQKCFLGKEKVDIHLDYFSFNIVTISLLSRTIEPYVIDAMRRNGLFSREMDREAFEKTKKYQLPSGSPYLLDHMNEKRAKKRIFSIFH